MRFKKDDLALIERSVFPDKVGKIGVVTSVDPTWDNPYEVDVPGDSTSRFEGPELQPVSVKDALRRYNALAGQIRDLKARMDDLEEGSSPAP